MLAANALAKYRQVQVTTASPGQIIVMLYDGLFRFLEGAKLAMEAKERGRAGEQIGRALAILEHLIASLDRSVAPQLCDHLEPLYIFCMQQVTQGNLRQDPTKLTDVVRVLTPLRDAWAVAAQKVASGESPLPSR